MTIVSEKIELVIGVFVVSLILKRINVIQILKINNFKTPSNIILLYFHDLNIFPNISAAAQKISEYEDILI